MPFIVALRKVPVLLKLHPCYFLTTDVNISTYGTAGRLYYINLKNNG